MYTVVIEEIVAPLVKFDEHEDDNEGRKERTINRNRRARKFVQPVTTNLTATGVIL